MISNFFIDRPIFAWVIAIAVMLVGGLAVVSLPIAQYPSIAPPAVTITVSYPGASADTVQSTVVQVIEQQMSGLDHLLYFTSESDKDGSMTITLSFEQGTNPDVAQVQVQNKLQLATPLLPPEVQQQGIRVAKAAANFLLVVGFVSSDASLSNADLADYIASNVQDPLSRTPGVGDFLLFGSQYAMRVWLDPVKLNNYQLTPSDVSQAIQAQNVQIAAGELGGLPFTPGQELNATILGPTRLSAAEQFDHILLKVNADGSQVRLRDVAGVGLGSETYAFDVHYNGKPASGIAIMLASGANALATAQAVRETLDKLRPTLPRNVQIIYPFDTTPFVRASIEEVVKTLAEAFVLVFLVMLLFLQNIRATFIPSIAVPVVLLGTFGVLQAFGYSINVLTMFGMVLAIGLLVDDAIVVVENVERVMREEGLSAREATRKSMQQITGALVGIAVVLTAVFLPMSFFSGSAGVIYRQFSVTMMSAMVLSVLVAIIFTPALCATLLKPHSGGDHEARGFGGWFNRHFENATHRYERSVNHILGRTGRYMAFFLVIVVLMSLLFMRVPGGFLPDEDQGIVFAQVITPVGTTKTRTEQALHKMLDYFLTQEKDAVEGVFTVSGFSFAGRGQNAGIAFVRLKPWDERGGTRNRAAEVVARANAHLQQISEGMALAFVPPAVLELGNAVGFDFELLDRGNHGHTQLMDVRNQLLAEVGKDPRLLRVHPNGLDDEPQYRIDIDWEKASALDLTVTDINDTLSAAWGSRFVNDFVDRGRVKRVFIQGVPASRMQPEDLTNWYVRNSNGQMVPFSAFSSASWSYGSPKLERFNGVPSIQILGQPAAGLSTGTALEIMKEHAQKILPSGFDFAWHGISFEETAAGSKSGFLYTVSIVVVFLSLAALYESWSIPVAVLLVVPLGVIGAIVATLSRGLANDVFFQVGLLTTVGLAAKNAILIVEFAKENHEKGQDLIAATVHAARQRLRPILMTSLAFILGVLPLAISKGAGSGGQNAIGTSVIGGMLTATVLAIFFVPVFFVVVTRLLAPPNAAASGTQHGHATQLSDARSI